MKGNAGRLLDLRTEGAVSARMGAFFWATLRILRTYLPMMYERTYQGTDDPNAHRPRSRRTHLRRAKRVRSTARRRDLEAVGLTSCARLSPKRSAKVGSAAQ